MSDGGKGSARRPAQVSDEQYAERWDQIFQRKKLTYSDKDCEESEARWMTNDAAEIRKCFQEDEE